MTDTPQEADGQETGKLAASVRLISLLTIASRLLGLVRDAAMAALFGNGWVLDAFTVAFRLPNLFRRLFGEGALTAAFLPALVRERRDGSPAAAWELARRMLVSLAVVLAVVVAAAEVGVWAVRWSAGPAVADGGLLLELLAILLPYVLLICVSAILSAVLHAEREFGVPALVPVVLNVGWLAAIGLAAWIWRSDPPAAAQAIAWGLVAAGVGQVVLPWWSARRRGLRLRSGGARPAQSVKGIWWNAAPVLAGLALVQANAAVDGLLAWVLAEETLVARLPEALRLPVAEGTASALYLGQRLFQFPLGVFGVALSTVLFTRLAELSRDDDRPAFRKALREGVDATLAIGLPTSVGLFILAEPLADLLFRRGAFDGEDLAQTAAMIRAVGVGAAAACLLVVLQRGFFAVDDRTTPLKIAGIGVAVNLLLDYPGLRYFGGVGLAWAATGALAVQASLAFWWLDRRVGGLATSAIGGALGKAAGISLLMGFLGTEILGALSDPSATAWLPLPRLSRVAVPVVACVAVYAVLARLVRLGGFAFWTARLLKKTG